MMGKIWIDNYSDLNFRAGDMVFLGPKLASESNANHVPIMFFKKVKKKPFSICQQLYFVSFEFLSWFSEVAQSSV